jgi:hypothetical protein
MKEKFSWNAASADNTLDLARSPTEIPSTFVNVRSLQVESRCRKRRSYHSI